MKSNYQHIFTPLTVKNMTIKNRIVMMPMGTNYGEQNGEMSFLHINYYKERAKGGTGLIIVENASVDSPQGSNGTTQLRIDHTAETCSVFHRSAELICTFVCKRREELADQIGMSRMDFYFVKTCREKFGKPCISMGNIRNPKVAEQILADGKADLIGMGRGLIAEPAWVNKVATGI